MVQQVDFYRELLDALRQSDSEMFAPSRPMQDFSPEALRPGRSATTEDVDVVLTQVDPVSLEPVSAPVAASAGEAVQAFTGNADVADYFQQETRVGEAPTGGLRSDDAYRRRLWARDNTLARIAELNAEGYDPELEKRLGPDRYTDYLAAQIKERQYLEELVERQSSGLVRAAADVARETPAGPGQTAQDVFNQLFQAEAGGRAALPREDAAATRQRLFNEDRARIDEAAERSKEALSALGTSFGATGAAERVMNDGLGLLVDGRVSFNPNLGESGVLVPVGADEWGVSDWTKFFVPTFTFNSAGRTIREGVAEDQNFYRAAFAEKILEEGTADALGIEVGTVAEAEKFLVDNPGVYQEMLDAMVEDVSVLLGDTESLDVIGLDSGEAGNRVLGRDSGVVGLYKEEQDAHHANIRTPGTEENEQALNSLRLFIEGEMQYFTRDSVKQGDVAQVAEGVRLYFADAGNAIKDSDFSGGGRDEFARMERMWSADVVDFGFEEGLAPEEFRRMFVTGYRDAADAARPAYWDAAAPMGAAAGESGDVQEVPSGFLGRLEAANEALIDAIPGGEILAAPGRLQQAALRALVEGYRSDMTGPEAEEEIGRLVERFVSQAGGVAQDVGGVAQDVGGEGLDVLRWLLDQVERYDEYTRPSTRGGG